MPKIAINEVDVTSPGQSGELDNVVYVPGFCTQLPSDYVEGKPRLYTDVKAFQADFGSTIPRLPLDGSASDYSSFAMGMCYDTGYIYAVELLKLGVPVVYHCLANRVPGHPLVPDNPKYETVIKDIVFDLTPQTDVSKIGTYELLVDKGLFPIKFLSNGGYVSKAVNDALVNIAATRGDCFALVDLEYKDSILNYLTKEGKINETKIESDVVSLEDTVDVKDKNKYSAIFAPWCLFNTPAIIADKNTSITENVGYYMPGSFGYLMAMAQAINNGANAWQAMAGSVRGKIPYIVDTKETLTNAIVDILQNRDLGISINPITAVNPFGIIVWGNRTLLDNSVKGDLTASSFLNIRNMCSDIKKRIFTTAR